MHLLTLVNFTNVSKNLRKSTLVNPKIYVNFWAPKFTSFGDSGKRPGSHGDRVSWFPGKYMVYFHAPIFHSFSLALQVREFSTVDQRITLGRPALGVSTFKLGPSVAWQTAPEPHRVVAARSSCLAGETCANNQLHAMGKKLHPE